MIPQWKQPFSNHSQKFIVLLFLTPSLTSLLDESDSFIANIVHQALGPNQRCLVLDVLAAAVDQISYPPDMFHQAQVLVGRYLSLGSEGLSVFITTSAAPNIWPFVTKLRPKLVASAEGTTGNPRCILPTNSAIDFSTLLSVYEPNSEDGSQVLEQQGILSFQFVPNYPKDPLHAALHTVELPLANTLFHNGRLSTLLAQRWAPSLQAEALPRLVCEKQDYVNGQLGIIMHEQGIRPPSIKLPRSWGLTPPRIIAESMGNIVRKLQRGESTIPASEELEESIANWTNRSDQDYEVWAQIMPSERWQGLPQSLGDPADVGQGCRLHRVLSGGGGWGSKQGLISLDPESGFAASHEENVFSDGQDLESEQQRALGQVARPGDVIQFLAFLLGKSPFSTKFSTQMKTLDHPSTTLGSTRSREYETVEQIKEKDTNPAHTGYKIVHGHFGAISETGISLQIQPLEHTSTEHGAHEPIAVFRTKLPPLASLTWGGR